MFNKGPLHPISRCFLPAFLSVTFLWSLRKWKQRWYKLSPNERVKNWRKFWRWSDKDIKLILKNAKSNEREYRIREKSSRNMK